MEENISSCLPLAMRIVGDAIRLDSQNCKKEAYCQYLSCCIYISQILKDDAWDKDIKLAYNKDSAKLFKLMQQCQERALTIISSEGIQPESSPTSSPVLPCSQTSLRPSQDHHCSDSPLPSGRPTVGPLRTSSGQLLNFPSPPSSPPTSGNLQSNTMKPSCPRSNYQDQRQIGHHLRVARFNTNNTDKTLTYLRKMAENLQIAKAREEAIRKKVWERQQRLQQEANRRFASAAVDSKEEQEQRALYTKILEFEQDMVWPRQLRAKLKEKPEDATLIKHIIDKIFSSKDHPLRQFLLQYQYHVYKKLLPLLKDVNFPNEKNLNTYGHDNVSANDKRGEAGVCPRLTKDNGSKDSNREEQSLKYNETNSEKEKDESVEKQIKIEELKEDDQELNIIKNLNDDESDKTNSEENISKLATNDNSDNAFHQDDVTTIVSSVMEEILEKIGKPNLEPPTAVNEEQEDAFPGEVKEDDESTSNTEQKIPSSNCADVGTWQESEVSSNATTDRSEIVDNRSSDSNKEIKHKNLLKIKSFDVESEFESLEDDMFDSESSDNEEEQQESKSADKQSYEDIVVSNDTSDLTSANSFKKDSTEDDDIENNSDNNMATEGAASNESVKDGPTSQEHTEPKISYEQELEMTRKQLNEIFVDMRFFLEKLKGFIILAYEELATPVGHEQCYAAVEYPFFQPLWPLLLGVLRRVNFDKELSLGGVMTKKIRNTPAEMGVIERLCLTDLESLKLTGNQYPYQSAVDQLQKVSASYCPLEKLDYIVHVLRSICQCVEDYWETKGKPRHCPETSIGCDDLLPILTYAIIRSGMAQLVSECVAMEEFIPEGYLMGEEGYCLTTLQTALSYLVQLDSSTQPDTPDGKSQDSN